MLQKQKTTMPATAIRDAIRAELPVLQAAAQRLVRLGRELQASPEASRWRELLDTPAEEGDEFRELAAVGTLADTLADGMGPVVQFVQQLAEDTDPKAWAKAARRGRAGGAHA